MQKFWSILGPLFWVILFAAAQVPQSRISALKTDADVKSLVYPLGWEYQELILGDSACSVYRPYAHTALRCTGQTWYRADFDANGWPDLLVVGRRKDIPFVFCVLDSGNNRLWVDRSFYNSLDERQPAARVIYRRGRSLLQYTAYARRRGNKGELQKRRTALLTYKGGGFVPVEERPTHHRIRTILYKSKLNYHGQFATTVAINASGLATLTYQVKAQGDSIASDKRAQRQLSQEELSSLSDLLNYIRFADCRSSYGSGMENHRTNVVLQVEYEDGTKTIHDSTGSGTLGLVRVYANLERLAAQLR